MYETVSKGVSQLFIVRKAGQIKSAPHCQLNLARRKCLISKKIVWRHKSAVLTCLVRKAKFRAIPNLNQIIQSLPSCESESHCTNCLDSSHSASQELSRKLVSHYQIVRRHNSLETASCKSSPSVLGYQQIKSLCVWDSRKLYHSASKI